MRGKKFFTPEGRIEFPQASVWERLAVKKDNSYLTRAGPCAPHTGQIYGRDTKNLADGVTRLTKSRLPMLVGAEEHFQNKQHTFVKENVDFINRLRNEYEDYFTEYTNAIEEARLHHADPHAKREPRIQSWNGIMDHGILYNNIWELPGKYAIYKVKIFEVAKPDKTIRCIGDLGCPASLQGFRIAGFLKNAMFGQPIAVNGGTIEFCKEPSSKALEDVFERLINPPGRFAFFYFSDDSCLSVRTKDGKVLRFNVDISSCDASHTSSLFDAYVRIHPKRLRSDAQALVDQCKQPITVVDLYNKKRKVTLKPKSPRLYSGSTITTAINNLACQLIGLSISQMEITCKDDVVKAAANAGYIVTCDDCEDWHQLQFLKHSPVLDKQNQLRALLNLGVLLRMSGTAKGDFIGLKGESMKTRVDRQQKSLLQGAYPRAHTLMIDSLKRNCDGGSEKGTSTQLQERVAKAIETQLAYKLVTSDKDEHFHVDSEEVYKRYGLTDLEILQMDVDFAGCGYGDHYSSSATNKIYLMDYGLQSAYLDGLPVHTPPQHHLT
jgi:hypothetical protein